MLMPHYYVVKIYSQSMRRFFSEPPVFQCVIGAGSRHPPEPEAIGDVRLVVSGHADRSGTENYNQALSQDRADAAAQALVAQGVAVGTIEARAYGESQPVFKTADGVREPGNRRVQFDLTR